jgi:nitrogen-specific signal transduction histidine kinase
MNHQQSSPDQIQRKLDVLKYMPTGCIVINRNAEIIDINKAATYMLRIKTFGFYTSRKLETVLGPRFNVIMLDLLKGESVNEEDVELKRIDNTLINVRIKASVFNGMSDMFLIEFTESRSNAIVDYPIVLTSFIHTLVLSTRFQLKKLFSPFEKSIHID